MEQEPTRTIEHIAQDIKACTLMLRAILGDIDVTTLTRIMSLQSKIEKLVAEASTHMPLEDACNLSVKTYREVFNTDTEEGKTSK